MKLVIDIGNTSTKLGLFEGKDMFSFSSVENCSLENIRNFIADNNVDFSIISSVRDIDFEIQSILDYYNSTLLSSDTPTPIKNKYKTLETLGKDRLSAVIGGHALYPNRDIIILDAGTCLTVDFINSEGEYIGGRISPGIEMRYKSLHAFTDQLPLLEKSKNSPFSGNDTNSSIVSGVQQGILSEIQSIISDYKLKNPNLITIITGGDCFYFEKELKNTIFAIPNLVLIGLNEILDYNA